MGLPDVQKLLITWKIPNTLEYNLNHTSTCTLNAFFFFRLWLFAVVATWPSADIPVDFDFSVINSR